jgi:hypothetical protein
MRQLIGSSAEWAANNLVLTLGEFGVEPVAEGTRLKIGDGATPYSALPFVTLTPTGSDPAVGVIGATKADKTIVVGGTNGLIGGGPLSADVTLEIAPNSNGYGIRTISTAQPTGGADGDIWYVV